MLATHDAHAKECLQRFLAGTTKMTDDDFNTGKRALREVRKQHVRELSDKESTDWLLLPGPPTGGPCDSLMEHHRTRGGTFVVSEVTGSGFQGDPTFHQGDMITVAYERALLGDKRVGILNMANAKTPGGGFLSGARAQEEQLCHQSNLFPRLKLHRYRQTHLQSYIAKGTCLVTRNVDILRGGKETMFAKVPTPARLTVLSAAAESYKSVEDAQDHSERNRKDLITTWKAILSGANAAGVEVLIVSALGCGAFNNPPKIVGGALATALAQCDPGMLQEIQVVIFEDHNSGGVNFLDFKKGYDESRTGPRKRKAACLADEAEVDTEVDAEVETVQLATADPLPIGAGEVQGQA